MADGQGRTTLISDFRGENYRLRDSLLPPNVSPDALNCDYFFNTIRKRNGWSVVNRYSPVSGAQSVVLGLFIQHDNNIYVIVGSPGTTYYDVHCYLEGTGLVGSASNVYHRLWAHRPELLGNSGETASGALWGQWKLPSWQNLSMAPLDVSLTTATPSGSGTFNGVRKYYIVARNSTDGHESDLNYSSLPGSAMVTSGSATNAAQYDLAGIPSSSDPQVDKVRIYATKTGGSVFYYLADINNGTTTYTDNKADASLTVPYNAFRGILPQLPTGTDQRTPVMWQDRLWAPGYENGVWVYKWTERSYGDGLPIYCLWYPDNYITLPGTRGLPWDVLPIGNTMILMAFSDGLFAIVGDNPGSYRLIPVQTGTAFYRLVLSNQYVYALGKESVVRIPLGMTGPVEDISGAVSLHFRGMQYPWGYARQPVAAYVPSRKEVWFTFQKGSEDVSNYLRYDKRVTMVWSEERETWARWDLPVDQYGDYFRQPVYREYIFMGVQGTLGKLIFNSEAESTYQDGIFESGTVTASGASSVTVSESPASTVEKYIGLKVSVTASDGTVQHRIINERFGKILNITEAWTANPVPGDTYTIGAIQWYWTSPRLALTDDRFGDKRIHRIKTAFHPVGNISSTNVKMTYRLDANAEQTKSLDATQRVHEVLAEDVGKELRLKYEHSTQRKSVEIEGIQIELEQQE